jgi:hypothetical protein
VERESGEESTRGKEGTANKRNRQDRKGYVNRERR